MTTILVVDDEASIVQLLSMLLEEEGYRVVTAHNGQEGLEHLATAQPALVLCDVMMPVLDGRELCRKMGSDPRYRSIPIILMTAVSKAFNASDCNCAALLTKPFELDDVLAVVARLTAPTSA